MALTAALFGSLLISSPAANAASATGTGGVFVPASGRVFDTANGIGGFSTPMPAQTWRTVQIAGTAGIPTGGKAGAVVLSATVLDMSGQGQLTGRPDSSTAATLMTIYGGGGAEDTSNSSIVALADDGTLQIKTETKVRLVLDVQGYYTSSASGTAAGGFVPVAGTRIVDTRLGLGAPTGTLASNDAATIQVTGKAGVPSGASAVVVTLIAVNTQDSEGVFTPYAAGTVRPKNSFHYAAGNLNTSMSAQVALSATGKITVFNQSSVAHLVVDVQGYFTAAGKTGSSFTPAAGRAYDSRSGTDPFARGETRAIQIAGTNGVPTRASGLSAVVITLTAVHSGSGEGRATVWANGATRPSVTSLSYVANSIRSNTVTVPVGSNGKISLYNIGEPSHFVIDIQGWYATTVVSTPGPADPTATPKDIVAGVAGSVLDETATDTGDLASKSSAAGVSLALEGNEAIVPAADGEAPEEGVDPADTTALSAVNFSVNYADAVSIPEEEGLTALSGKDADTSAVVQQTATGVRVLTTITSATAPADYSYTFDVPATAELTQDESGIYIEDDTDVYGVLDQPWAVDAAGNALPTTYSWSAGTLTQHIDLGSAVAFPVVADPAWKYSYDYKTSKTPLATEKLLRSCFNCYFPVAGAPRAFPSYNQLLPLTVAKLGNFECRMGGIAKVTGSLFQYSFIATKNHIDGEGSSINFSFRKNKKLVVTAYIKNHKLNNFIYKGGANLKWSKFASNLKAA